MKKVILLSLLVLSLLFIVGCSQEELTEDEKQILGKEDGAAIAGRASYDMARVLECREDEQCWSALLACFGSNCRNAPDRGACINGCLDEAQGVEEEVDEGLPECVEDDWEIGEWGEWSTECGDGVRSRDVNLVGECNPTIVPDKEQRSERKCGEGFACNEGSCVQVCEEGLTGNNICGEFYDESYESSFSVYGPEWVREDCTYTIQTEAGPPADVWAAFDNPDLDVCGVASEDSCVEDVGCCVETVTSTDCTEGDRTSYTTTYEHTCTGEERVVERACRFRTAGIYDHNRRIVSAPEQTICTTEARNDGGASCEFDCDYDGQSLYFCMERNDGEYQWGLGGLCERDNSREPWVAGLWREECPEGARCFDSGNNCQ